MLGTGNWARDKWRNQQFLMWKVLSVSTVMEYFCQSPFYEAGDSCINKRELLGFKVNRETWTGHEYRLVYVCDNAKQLVPVALGTPFNYNAQFTIFIVQKFQLAKGRVTPSDVFYILGGTIYPTFTLGDLVRHRALAVLEHQHQVLDESMELHQWSYLSGDKWGESVTGAATETLEPDTNPLYDLDGSIEVRLESRGYPNHGIDQCVEMPWQRSLSTLTKFALNAEGLGTDETEPPNLLNTNVLYDQFNVSLEDRVLHADGDFLAEIREEALATFT